MDHEEDDPGTTWNADARKRDADRMSPRQAWRAIQAGLPKDAIISSDIGNNCAIGNAYPAFDSAASVSRRDCSALAATASPQSSARRSATRTACVGFAGDGAFGISMSEMSSIGREEWPGITMVIFRNYQWGAEKRNSILSGSTMYCRHRARSASQLCKGSGGLRPPKGVGRRRPS